MLDPTGTRPLRSLIINLRPGACDIVTWIDDNHHFVVNLEDRLHIYLRESVTTPSLDFHLCTKLL